MDLDHPLRTAEFLVVDTETNGLAGDACEVTEIGAVLVGGGELHERWETLLSVREPLSRGIQRFTGITQAMVDAAPPAEAMLPELAEQLRGRALVAHSASFDRRVLIQAFARAGLPWPNPPALPRRPRARNTDGGGVRVRGARRRLPDLRALTDDPGVYVVRNAEGKVLYVGKSVSVRTRARAHFAPSAAEGAWTAQAETVEHEVTSSELGALLLESRLVKRLRPPGNVRLKHVDAYVYLRCRLDIAFPVLEVAPGPAAGRAGGGGPLRGRSLAGGLPGQLDSLVR